MKHEMSTLRKDKAKEKELQIQLQKPRKDSNTLWYPSKSQDFVVRWNSPSTPSEEEHNPDPSKKPDKKNQWLTNIESELCDVTKDSADQKPKPMDDEIDVYFSGQSTDSEWKKARCLISHANKRQTITASLRFSGASGGLTHNVPPPIKREFLYQISKPVDRQNTKHVFSPDAVADCVLQELGLVSWESSTKPIYDIGFHNDQIREMPTVNGHPTGLIVIAGGTGTGKSAYARSLILRWIIRVAMKQVKSDENRLSEYDAPHLVTFEDPIETWSYYRWKPNAKTKSEERTLCDTPESDLHLGIRLTSRARGKDVGTLNEAVLHALRQKPRVIYIGECRQEDDWNQAIQLGATGHLVVTTCHSSTLVDTFMKLAGDKKRSAQSRQQLAASLLGVLHLRTSEFEIPEGFGFSGFQTQFHLWKNTPESVSNFVMDGLSSVVSDGDNIISRMTMASKILKIQKQGFFDKKRKNAREIYEEFEKQAILSGFALDIRGQ
jgi:Tfp pilus assembly pilus retraction ATPase PilT